MGSKEHLDGLKIDFNAAKIITVQDYNKNYCEWKYIYTKFKLRVKQVIYESNIQWQHKKAKVAWYSARDLHNLLILPENLAEGLWYRRECCWSYLVSVLEIPPKNIVVQGRTQLKHNSYIVKVGVKATC